MVSQRSIHEIKEDLNKTQELIFETKELLKLYPEQKGLLIDIKSLEHLEKDLIDELESFFPRNRMEVFELSFDGKAVKESRISASSLGEFLFEFQDIISAIHYSKFKGPLHKGRKIPLDYVQESQLNVLATATGSFKIIFSSNEPTLLSSPLKESFDQFIELAHCEDDGDLLKSQIEKLGNGTIHKYKNFLRTIYQRETDIQFIDKSKSVDKTEYGLITSKLAKKILDVIIEEQKTPEEEVVIVGTFKAIDLLSHRFKFLISKSGEEKDKIITGYFDKKLEKIIEERLNKISKARFLFWTDIHEIEGEEVEKYQLLGVDE